MKTFRGVKDTLTVKATAEFQANYGKTEAVELTLTYKKINSVDKVQELLRCLSNLATNEIKIISDHLVKWDLQYDDGDEVPLDPETVAAVWEIAPYRKALSESFLRVQLDAKGLAEKN